jgi:hypothetical protein
VAESLRELELFKDTYIYTYKKAGDTSAMLAITIQLVEMYYSERQKLVKSKYTEKQICSDNQSSPSLSSIQ